MSHDVGVLSTTSPSDKRPSNARNVADAGSNSARKEVVNLEEADLAKYPNKKQGAKRPVVASLALAVASIFVHAQTPSPADKPAHEARQTAPKHLNFVSSDIRPTSLFWIQGRFVPIDDPGYAGHAEVVTILCSVREYECLEVEGDNVYRHIEEAWIQEFKIANWTKQGILATSHSFDHCTEQILKIGFAPPSVDLISSPASPLPEPCTKLNVLIDKLRGKKGFALKIQTEQDVLVPTRGPSSFQDVAPEEVPASSQSGKH